MLETQPHALSARYDAKAERIIVELTNGATFAFPPALVEDLCEATPAQLAEVEVLGAGFGCKRCSQPTAVQGMSSPTRLAG